MSSVSPARYAETWARDGGSRPGEAGFEALMNDWLADFPARRVVALQDGEVIFSMAASFQDADEESAVSQVEPAPVLSGPEGPVYDDFLFLVSTEVRVPEQPHPSALWPTRAWVQFTVDLQQA